MFNAVIPFKINHEVAGSELKLHSVSMSSQPYSEIVGSFCLNGQYTIYKQGECESANVVMYQQIILKLVKFSFYLFLCFAHLHIYLFPTRKDLGGGEL